MATAQTRIQESGGEGRLPSVARLAVGCGALGFLIAAIFSLVIYPRIAGSANAVLDPDGHGALGWGFYKFHTFSFYPNSEPTIARGPLYPLAVAAILWLAPGQWPANVQLVQDIWCGITCALTFELGRRLFGRRAGLLAGVFCAFYPLLVWYSPRIWIESMTIMLFTAFLVATLRFMQAPSMSWAVIVGFLIGLLCLAKGTFLPFIGITPGLLFLVRRKSGLLRLAAVALVAVLTVLPWTLRNWTLTHRFLPVHGQVGFNLRIGDQYTAHASETGYNFLPHWNRVTSEASLIFQQSRAQGDPGWLGEMKVNDAMQKDCLHTYAANPLFLIRKMLVNAVGFWTLSETTKKSIAAGLLHLPLLVAFCVAMFRLIRRRRFNAMLLVPMVISGIYYLSHLPFLGAVRYSAVVVPAMIVYAVGGWLESARPKTAHEVAAG